MSETQAVNSFRMKTTQQRGGEGRGGSSLLQDMYECERSESYLRPQHKPAAKCAYPVKLEYLVAPLDAGMVTGKRE